jgi:N6-adenosine-specific RNA methylase IME4
LTLLRHLPAGGTLQSCELELNPKQGPSGAVSLESLAMVGTGGNVIQYRTAITDITRRRNAEDDLRRSEEKFLRLYGKAPLAIDPWTKTALFGRSTRPGWTSWDTPGRR